MNTPPPQVEAPVMNTPPPFTPPPQVEAPVMNIPQLTVANPSVTSQQLDVSVLVSPVGGVVKKISLTDSMKAFFLANGMTEEILAKVEGLCPGYEVEKVYGACARYNMRVSIDTLRFDTTNLRGITTEATRVLFERALVESVVVLLSDIYKKSKEELSVYSYDDMKKCLTSIAGSGDEEPHIRCRILLENLSKIKAPPSLESLGDPVPVGSPQPLSMDNVPPEKIWSWIVTSGVLASKMEAITSYLQTYISAGYSYESKEMRTYLSSLVQEVASTGYPTQSLFA